MSAPITSASAVIRVHAPNDAVREVALLSALHSVSPIYSLRGNDLHRTAQRTLATHREIAGEPSDVLLDANRYAGTNRRYGDHPLSSDWLMFQADNGLPTALTDSGYVRSITDLRTLLANAAETAQKMTGPVRVSLPADSALLQYADTVRDLVDRTGIPIALAFGHKKDPLARADAVEALLHIIESPIDVALMRTDLSALGAVAAGASFGAVGTTSTYRHIWPPSGHGGRTPPTSALAPRLLCFRHLEMLALAAAQMPKDYFVCECVLCDGLPLVERVTEVNAAEHSVAAIAELAVSILRSPSAEIRLRTFQSKLHTAQVLGEEMAAEFEDPRWRAPASVNAWVKALGRRPVG